MKRMLAGTAIGLGMLLGVTGCRPDAAVEKAEVVGRGTKPAGDPPVVAPTQEVPDTTQPAAAPAGMGVVRGVIRFNGKAPAKVKIDTSMDPACGIGNKGPVYSEQYVVNDGKLANVFVYVKSGPAGIADASSSGQPVVLDQKGCQYTPHVVGVVRGGYVEFRNSDSTMHNIHTMPAVVGNETIDVSQGPKGTPVVKQMQTPELMIPVRCNNHPWMNAFINVAPNPFFAVSDASGKFEIRGLPAGTYTLGAVQEKMGEQTITVTVPAQGTASADFSYTLNK